MKKITSRKRPTKRKSVAVAKKAHHGFLARQHDHGFLFMIASGAIFLLLGIVLLYAVEQTILLSLPGSNAVLAGEWLNNPQAQAARLNLSRTNLLLLFDNFSAIKDNGQTAAELNALDNVKDRLLLAAVPQELSVGQTLLYRAVVAREEYLQTGNQAYAALSNRLLGSLQQTYGWLK